MTLTLTYCGDTSIPVEIEGLTPDWAADKSPAEIEKFEIFHGNRRLPLAEMFDVTGNADDKHMVFEGDLAGVHWIGAHMASGRIDIVGNGGRHIGSDLRGGEINAQGNTGDWLGAEMRRGWIRVRGNAGDLVGGAYRGSPRGMTGGSIVVAGHAGHEIGCSMRRGLIAIGGSAGTFAGFNMIAGTVLVFGESGPRPGAGMRRGMLGLFGKHPPALLPTFRYTATHRPQVIAVILRTVREQGLAIDDALLSSEFDFYQGDLLTVGRGEIVFRHGQ